MITGTCAHCGQHITLLPFGQSFKWVSDVKHKLWVCDPNPEFPVRAHAPAEGADVQVDIPNE